MRFLTFNIWNHDSNFDERLNLLTSLIVKENADIVALQEVRSNEVVNRINQVCNYKYIYWKKYHDCEEGLAILSSYEISTTWSNWDENTDVHNSGSLCIEFEKNGLKFSVSNVHLDYRFAHNREIEILKLTDYIEKLDTDYNIMLGDFNTYPNSSIHGYLTGRQSLNGRSVRWIDLCEVNSVKSGKESEVTIDFYNNPRWSNDSILDVPGRFDWILLENPYPKPYPDLVGYKLLGRDLVNGITASDHYGVVCNIEFGD